MSYYKNHIFFCLNTRVDGSQCCSDYNAENIFNYMKKKIKTLNLNGPNKTRINKGGCLDRCQDGPLMVVYPQGIWYRYFDEDDIDEIVDQHLIHGNIVTRLLI
jgi:(2Fe-2S) ferredoxin|tara:strand:- start:6194 stop:6502 length:309 start_codon:yes stop_codon:yes gene_type:complete